ncbi:hypothetical protein MLD38_017708 [Melastoma candidum]|uniref:Uncharacterized protein n=1 Tax=Melastoma candidum TaxID=119954 RepID=A0ACB9QSU5_9MYRT|nr:hypothetical protein MLD38_017708 [Melastoma candidum]
MRRPAGFHHGRIPKHGPLKGMIGKLSLAVFFVLFCAISFTFSSSISGRSSGGGSGVFVLDQYRLFSENRPYVSLLSLVWKSSGKPPSGGWRPSSTPRSDWRTPPTDTNGYLRVRCNGGLNQQCSAICNAVLAAWIMNATLVLPELELTHFGTITVDFRVSMTLNISSRH